MKKKIALIVMGCGGVGRQLLQHIVSCRSLHADQGVHLRVVGVCDSKSLLVVSDVLSLELDDNFLNEVCRAKLGGSSLETLNTSGLYKVFSNTESTRIINNVASILGRSEGLAFVDCTASSGTIEVLKIVVNSGCCVVMANKKPLTSSMEDYDKLIECPRRIRYTAAVGGSLPFIASLNRIISSGDPVHRVMGSLSGTMGYVMSEVEDGKPFSKVVNSAKALGYTEPDLRDDLGGMDVARKALILARLLGRRIEMENIKVESLYPKEMGPSSMSVDDFLENGLPLLDKGIQERVKKASSNGNVLRYVCLIDNSRCEVGIQEVPKASALGRLGGVALILARLLGRRIEMENIKVESLYPEEMGPSSMSVDDFLENGLPLLDKGIQERVKKASSNGNVLRYVCLIDNLRCEVGIQEVPKASALGRLGGVLEISSRCYNQRPLVIQGGGGGNDATAAGVLADILDLQDLFH